MFKKIKSVLVNKETILYIVFGVLTTIINIAVASFCYRSIHVSSESLLIALSNCIAWVISVIFAFITNKIYVFESKTTGIKAISKELASFMAARGLSLIIDLAGMYVLVDTFDVNFTISKILVNVIVVILNYVLSKLFIFKSQNT